MSVSHGYHTNPHGFARIVSDVWIELLYGIERKSFVLKRVEEKTEAHICYYNEWISLEVFQEQLEGGQQFRLYLKNVSKKSIRVSRISFAADGGLGAFLEYFNPKKISFLRNGYQSWSTARSYRISEKPLRPRTKLMSMATSNMSNLPSNTPGQLSSEMYSVIMNLEDNKAMLVGQLAPFNQFFYTQLNVNPRHGSSKFTIIFDFGMQLLNSGRHIQLDSFLIISGQRSQVEQCYFHEIRNKTGYTEPAVQHVGWSSWYQYYTRINPELLFNNLKALKERGMPFDFFQIDDGWQSQVGDWLDESPAFKGRMGELASAIHACGCKAGLWLAPFACSKSSEFYRLNPELVLKNAFGQRLKAGFNPVWREWYYGLDASHPRFLEYLREVIRNICKEWGYEYLKCDFLFTACLRDSVYHDLDLSRAMVLKKGMSVIRHTAGAHAFIIGSGMPLSAGIGTVDAMRVGPDTGDFWIQWSAKLLRTGAMVGVRNSLRNSMVRSPMNRRLWLNDPDCLLVRKERTRLSLAERESQIAVIALSGGMLTFSDDLTLLCESDFEEMKWITEIAKDCSQGQPVAVDIMEREIPQIFFNSAGYVAFFNFYPKTQGRYDLAILKSLAPGINCLVDLRTREEIKIGELSELSLAGIPKHGVRLFKIIGSP